MNRIKISPLASCPIDESGGHNNTTNLTLPTGSPQDSSDSFELNLGQQKSFSVEDSCLFVPLHYAKNYSYPLIVWLHNNGDDPQQIHRVMPKLSLQNYVAIAPSGSVGNRHTGFYWEQDTDSIEYATEAVIQSIDYAKARTNIDSNRIFVAGYGDAGTMAYRVALTHPEIITGGVASLNGPLPQGHAPLGRWGVSRNVDVFWAHCRKSDAFDQETLCQQLRLLHVAGFSVTLRQYPGGDQLSAPALADLNRWIMEMIDTTIS